VELTRTDWKNPIHPGEILADELEFIRFDAAQPAERLGIPENYHLSEFIVFN
jgi:plasmid maintenance system antidote protein VapI